MTKQSRSPNTETPPSTTRVANMVLSRSNYSQTTIRIHSELTEWTTACPAEVSNSGRLRSHQGQPWVKRPELKQHDPSRPRAKDYCSFHDCKEHWTSQCRSSASISKILSSKNIFENTFLHPKLPPDRKITWDLVSGLTSKHGHWLPSGWLTPTLLTRPLYMITQYRAVD